MPAEKQIAALALLSMRYCSEFHAYHSLTSVSAFFSSPFLRSAGLGMGGGLGILLPAFASLPPATQDGHQCKPPGELTTFLCPILYLSIKVTRASLTGGPPQEPTSIISTPDRSPQTFLQQLAIFFARVCLP